MEDQRLKIFLIRTLCKTEEKLEPGKVRLRSLRIGELKWTLGDIAVRKSRCKVGAPPFHLEMLAHGNYNPDRGNLIHSPIIYTKVTIEVKFVTGTEILGPRGAKEYHFTFEADFTDDRLSVVIPHENLAGCCPTAEYFLGELKGYHKVCIINHNRIYSVDGQGKPSFLLLCTENCRHAESFGFRDILVSLSTTWNYSEYNRHWLSIWKALTYLWVDEAYEYRLVMQHVNEHCEESDSVHFRKIDRAIRFLASHMSERRLAIKELIVDPFVDTAAKLGLSHPTLVRMGGLTKQLEYLQEVTEHSRLDVPILKQLGEIDLGLILPLFEHEIKRIYLELGEVFASRFKTIFRILSGLQDLDTFSKWSFSGMSPQTGINTLVYYVLTKIHIQSAEYGGGAPQKLYLLPKPEAAGKEVTGWSSVLFHSLHRFGQKGEHDQVSRDPFRFGLLNRLKAILTESNGHLLKNRHLFCWKDNSASKFSTVVTLIDLEKFDLLLSDESATINNEPEHWISTEVVDINSLHTRWLAISNGTVIFLEYVQSIIHVLSFLPRFAHKKYPLSEHLSPMDFDAITDKSMKILYNPSYSRDYHHFPLHYCKRVGLLLFADSWQGWPAVFKEREGLSVRTRLWAIRIDQGGQRLKLVAASDFPLPSWPKEMAGLRQFNTNWMEQGMSMSTYNAPFSPLRWCTSRLNVYCIWLIGPHSHIVFGLKRDRFVQLSSRLRHNSLSGELPYVLPALAANHIGGMCGLFWAQRKWNSQHKAYFVEVFQLKLERN